MKLCWHTKFVLCKLHTTFLQTSFEVCLNFVRSRHKFGVKFMQSQLRQGSYKVSAKFVQSKDEVYTYVQVRRSFTMSTWSWIAQSLPEYCQKVNSSIMRGKSVIRTDCSFEENWLSQVMACLVSTNSKELFLLTGIGHQQLLRFWRRRTFQPWDRVLRNSWRSMKSVVLWEDKKVQVKRQR